MTRAELDEQTDQKIRRRIGGDARLLRMFDDPGTRLIVSRSGAIYAQLVDDRGRTGTMRRVL